MRSRKLFAIGIILAFGAVSSSLLAQSRVNSSGTGGLHVIQGRVFLPNGKALDSPVKVELQSYTQPTVSVHTDQNGSYKFAGISPGNYSVVVDAGESFEVTREDITIDGEVQLSKTFARSTTKTFTIPLYLQPKRGQTFRSGTINAKWASVPRASIEHYEKGVEFMQAEKVAEAIVEFNKSIDLHPSFAPSHTQLGRIYLRKGQLDQSITSLRSAVKFDASDFDAHVHLGIALLNKMDLAGAERELVEAAFLNTQSVTPHYYLGVLFVEKKDYDVAQKAFEKAKQLKRETEYPLVHRYLGGIYEAKKLSKQAVEELETYLRLQPNAKDADRLRQTIADLKSKRT